MSRVPILAACVVLLLLPVDAAAQFLSVGDFDFSLTETVHADSHWGENVTYQDALTGETKKDTYDFFDIKNRFNLSADSAWLSLGARLDSAHFFGPESGEARKHFDDTYTNDLTLEKVFMRVRRRGLTIEIGDVYGCLGKGMALCVKKLDELSIDTTLRGAKAVYQEGMVGVTAMGGLSNIVNVGDKLEERLDDPDDLVVGLEGRLAPLSWMRVTAHTSIIKDKEQYDQILGGNFGRQSLSMVGGTFSIPDLFGFGSFFVEYDRMTNRSISYEYDSTDKEFQHSVHGEEGSALYAATTLDWGLFHLLGEMKWYDGMGGDGFVGANVEFREDGTTEPVYYAALPPLEDDQLFLQPEYYDVLGGRVRLDAELPWTNSVLFINYAYFDDQVPDEVETVGDQQFVTEHDYFVRHFYGGIEQRVDKLSIVGTLSAGSRREKKSGHDWAMRHVAGDVVFPLFGVHSMELEGRFETYDDTVASDFSISRMAATYAWAPIFSLSGVYEHSDEPPTHGKENFLSGELVCRFRSDSSAKVIVGDTRGGLRCAGGVCRIFPPFSGVRGELTLRF